MYENGTIRLMEEVPGISHSEVLVTFLEEKKTEVTNKKPPKVGVRFGSLKGKFSIPDDFNEPMEDLKRLHAKKLLLIDTQILIWSITEPHKLKEKIENLLSESTVLVSQIVFVEIAMKQAVGKVHGLDMTISELIGYVVADGFQILPLTNEHINAYASIPFYQQHKDPFDRLILAVALQEKLRIVSADGNFRLYRSVV